MSAWTILRYLLGNAEAIRAVASTRAACPTGVILVLLTAIARNYDQSPITESTLLWLLSPLLFSLGSGSLVFGVLHLALRWNASPTPPVPTPGFGAQWLSFMGLFWMTAPIAWLYAIPVERFLGSYQAAQANLTLLAVVAAWRVLLMARVTTVVTGAGQVLSLAWVLVPTSAEVIAIYVFGGPLSRRIMAGMGGLRNSPEEELLLRAMGNAASCAFWVLPIAFVAGLVLRARVSQGRHFFHPFPKTVPVSAPWLFLGLATVGWIAAAIPSQLTLQNNAAVEQLVKKGKYREALELLDRHRPEDFAPARVLPPKAFETTVFTELPELFAVVSTNDAPWVRAHLMRRLEEMSTHFIEPWQLRHWDQPNASKRRQALARSAALISVGGKGWVHFLTGLKRLPEGRDWLSRQDLLLDALADTAAEAPDYRRWQGHPEEDSKAGWTNLATHLRENFGKVPAPPHAPLQREPAPVPP